MRLYLRWEHGNHLVKWKDGELVVEYPQGEKTFKNWKSLSADLQTTLSFRSYFRFDSVRDDIPEFISEFFTEYQNGLLQDMESALDEFFRTQSLGIDIQKKQKDIRKLVLAGFGRRIFLGKYDPEDIIQEVFKGLIIRNRGKCPWDQKKSSFGHYVHMVAGCILNNYHRKQQRTPVLVEPLETEADYGQWGDCEIEDSADVLSTPTSHDLCSFVVAKGRQDGPRIREVFPHLVAGFTINEISDKLGLAPSRVSKLMKTIRLHSAQWAKQNDMEHLVPKSFQDPQARQEG